MAGYLIQQYISSSGEWIPLGGEGGALAALEAQVAELERIVAELQGGQSGG